MQQLTRAQQTDANEDEEVLAAVAHFIMAHNKEKEGIKKKKKKKYKPTSGQYQLKAGIKRFGEHGESAVTKELNQFNKYKVFEPTHANDLPEEQAMLAANNLGLDFSSKPTKVTGGEVIEILDDSKEEVMNEYK